jgi:hypothetical protein
MNQALYAHMNNKRKKKKEILSHQLPSNITNGLTDSFLFGYSALHWLLQWTSFKYLK